MRDVATSIAFDILAKDRTASKTFATVGKSADKVGGKLDQAGKSAEKSGARFEKMGKLAKVGGAAVVAAALVVGKGLLSAMDNEKVNDRLAASLGATPKLAEKYGKIASNLYAGAWGESMADVSSAIEAVSSSFRGLGAGKGLEKVTAQALDFATIFEVDLPRAVSVAATMVQSKLAKNATQALDLLTVAAQKVPKALREDVLDATEEYGQFFHTIGMDGPQAMATLVAASKKGRFGIDKIGDAVKEFTIRSTDMSTASKDAYKMIGLDAGKMANKMLAGGKKAGRATQDIVKGLLGIQDPAKRANAAIALFGTPIEDLNVRDIPAFLKSLQSGEKGLGKFEGAIDKAGATLNDNASTKIEGWKRSITTAFVNTLGGKVLPVLEKFGTELHAEVGPAVKELGGELKSKFGPTLSKLGGFVKDKLIPAMRDLAKKWLEGVRGGFKNVNKSMKDNKPFIDQIKKGFAKFGEILVTKIMPAMGKIYSEAFPAIGKVIGTGITWLKKLTTAWLFMSEHGVRSLRILLGAALKTFSGILRAADVGMGWIPGIGPDIHKAKVAFDKFKDSTIVNLGKTADALRRTREAINKVKSPKPVKVTVDATNGLSVLAEVARRLARVKSKTVFVGVNAPGAGGGPGSGGPGVGSNAHGTNHWRGGLTRLHEQGPEIVDLPRGARVYPAGRSAQMVRDATGGGSGGGVTINFYGPTDPIAAAREIRKMLLQLKRTSGVDLGLT